MQNIRLDIEYDGSHFYGWEIQPNKKTIRGEIEFLLENVLNEKIKLVGAVRTDRGVHAINQVANFKTTKDILPEKIKMALMKLLPYIYVKEVKICPLEFNSRYDAKSKIYLYKILLGKSPLLHKKVYECTFPIDINKIKKYKSLFIGTHNFALFSYKDNGICEIKKITMEVLDKQIIFEIEGNRFLHKMVRMIVGALIELGRGKINEEDIKLALELKSNRKFVCAPPYGLYLKEVKY